MQTTYGDISPRTAGWAVRKLLEVGQHDMIIERFGQMDPQGKKKTKVRKWRRYLALPAATSPLAEGIPPAGRRLTYTDITATLEQYGDSVELTDVIADTHEDPVFQETVKRCGEQIAETVETLRINVLKAGTTVYYANNAANRAAVNSPPTRGDFRRVYRAFKRNKAREISEIIAATAKVSTEPVLPAYFAMGHTDLDSDIRGISGFVPVSQYSDSRKALPTEVGSVEQIRICLTALFSAWTTAGTAGTTYLANASAPSSSTQCDVYPMIIAARDSYAIVPLQGMNAVTPGVIQPNKVSKSDPLGQKGFVSWKTYQACAILNQTWLARLECAATAVPS